MARRPLIPAGAPLNCPVHACGLYLGAEAIADTLSETFDGDFDRHIEIEGAHPSMQKLAMLVNFTLNNVVSTLAARDAANEALREQVERSAKLQRQIADYAKALERASDARETFLASMSHELRTPLNHIAGFAALAQAALRDQPPTPAGAHLAQISAAAVELTTQIESILAMTAESTTVDLANDETIDVEALLRLSVAAEAVTDRAAASVTVAPPDRVMQVLVDRIAFEKAIRALLSNALKFTPPDGAITLSARRDPDGGGGIVVEDSGPGIPPAERQAVLEPFVKGRDARAAGAGLGLARVQAVMQAHGGEVLLGEAPGGGLAARLVLPADRVFTDRRPRGEGEPVDDRWVPSSPFRR
jgi:signal transduction histidine kinase